MITHYKLSMSKTKQLLCCSIVDFIIHSLIYYNDRISSDDRLVVVVCKIIDHRPIPVIITIMMMKG